ncbi:MULTISPECIES: sigma-54-dependent transcriptional regulator [unclassified Vibrio]|uniref:sigma-54-dependent transcriptional regulator n=2 Tax=Vibrio TaxID=662 RepID=UPI000B8EB0AE|nr:MULTISPECIES: sigma-54 dependent transcriptional regulator [unclassified Vibrio]MCR9421082.1 sigma-54 dependent transcriptional regulator [Vibrio sp. RM-69-4]NAX18804.1 response regulator [Vibrio sp. V22_P2S10T140]OXX66208.1 two-component system response regulator [Vibrio sp. V10_P2A27P122]PSD41050.1 sigma-54-dependent Fis family transcriptional regulator [Vibrio sp. V02_P2A34T13]
MNHNYSVLLIDDDQDVLDSYSHLMSIANLPSKALLNPTKACEFIHSDWAGVILLDVYMPQMNGIELLKAIKSIDEHIPVIVITGHGDIPMAVEAVKIGACDFLEKPINPAELLSLVKKNLDIRRHFVQQKTAMANSIKCELIGKSAQMGQIRHHVAQYSMLNSHVVICGESGVGRHTIAYLIHQLTQGNHSSSLVELTVSSATTLTQIEQKLDASENGTLLIDHIELLSEELQRYLTQRMLNQERLSKARTRVIAILGTEPEALITANRLQPELYYLLNQGVIEVPVLRHRPDDIATLFHYFLKQSCNKLAKPLPAVELSYLSLLRAHQWPGNVRELRNVAELYAIGIVKLTGKERLYNQSDLLSPLDELVDDYEKQIIEDALFLHSGRVADAANYLQVPRKKLYLRMKKHGLEKDDFKSRY